MINRVSEAPAMLLTAAAFVIVVAGLQAASAIVIPFLLAVFIATLCAPPLFWMVRQGVPKALAVLIILAALVVLAVIMLIFLSRSLTALTQQLPTYQDRLLLLHNQVVAWLNSHGLQIETDNVILADYFSPRFIMTLVYYSALCPLYPPGGVDVPGQSPERLSRSGGLGAGQGRGRQYQPLYGL